MPVTRKAECHSDKTPEQPLLPDLPWLVEVTKHAPKDGRFAIFPTAQSTAYLDEGR